MAPSPLGAGRLCPGRACQERVSSRGEEVTTVCAHNVAVGKRKAEWTWGVWQECDEPSGTRGGTSLCGSPRPRSRLPAVGTSPCPVVHVGSSYSKQSQAGQTSRFKQDGKRRSCPVSHRTSGQPEQNVTSAQ